MSILYLGTALVIVLVIVLSAYTFKRKNPIYTPDFKLAVKTSRGLIKMNNEMLADELEIISMYLRKHRKTSQITTFAPVIKAAIENIKLFIADNPGYDMCQMDERADIVNQYLDDSVTPFDDQRNAAYKAIVENDSVEYFNDEQLFEYMLRHIDMLIKLLHNEVCQDGIFDLEKLEKLLFALDDAIFTKGQIDQPILDELHSRIDPYDQKPEKWFLKDAEQLEGFTSIENDPTWKTGIRSNGHDIPMVESHKRYQERSEMFKNNEHKFYGQFIDDETLLIGSNVPVLY